MGLRSVASDARQNDAGDQEPGERGREQLRVEAAQRSKRIQGRRDQQLKKEAAKRMAKRNRMFKVMGIWLAVLIAGFLIIVWFSPDLMKMLRDMLR